MKYIRIMSMKNIFYISTAILALAVIVSLALPDNSNAIDNSSPEKFADSVANKIIEIIESDKSNSAKQDDLIEIFTSYVDTDWMGKFALGKYYRQLNNSQKEKYLDLYREYVIYTYIPRFKEYSGERIQILSATKQGGDEYLIKSFLNTSKSKTKILVDYRVRKNAGKFKIIDVIGEGVSLITTQRSDFAAPISQKGVDFFIQALERKVKYLKSKA